MRQVRTDCARRPQFSHQRTVPNLVQGRHAVRRQAREHEARSIVDARAHGEEREVGTGRQRHMINQIETTAAALIRNGAAAMVAAVAIDIAIVAVTVERRIKLTANSTAAVGDRGQRRLARKFAQRHCGDDEQRVVGSESAESPHLRFELVNRLRKREQKNKKWDSR